MTDKLRIRTTSFALAAFTTWSVCAGIDTLAREQHSGGLQMSQAKPAVVVAAAAPAATAVTLGN